MNIVNEIFLDIYTFVVSQIGLLALGWIARGWLGTTAKQEINKLVTGDDKSKIKAATKPTAEVKA